MVGVLSGKLPTGEKDISLKVGEVYGKNLFVGLVNMTCELVFL